MDALFTRYCVSLLLFTAIGTRAGGNETNPGDPREPRVSGRIVKLYSGTKPEPYFCTGEGFQADPSNCAAFYRCVKERSGKFTVFRYQCAPGTVYDPDVETCNHPRSTRRSECGGMLKPIREPPHTSYINEIDGARSEVPRPISTKEPIYTEQTIIKSPTTLSIVNTERQNMPTNLLSGSTTYNYYSPSTTSRSQQKTTQFSGSTTGYLWASPVQHQVGTEYILKTISPTQTTQQRNSKNNNPCSSDGFMGDSENCQKFYRCVGNQRGDFVKYEFSCSESTVWDDEIQGCNYPWAVKRSKCGRSLAYNDKSATQSIDTTERFTTKEPVISDGGYGYKSNKTIQQQLQISHGSVITQTQTQISKSDKVIQNQTQIVYGDKMKHVKKSESKQNQTQISYGAGVSQMQTQINYGNKGVQTQLQIDHYKDSSQSQTQIQESTTNQSSQNNNNKCSESGFIGDDNDCKKFYRCVDNGRGSYTKFEYFCGDGTVWDPEIDACNHEWAVKHCGGKLPSEPTKEEHSTTTPVSTEYHTVPTKTTQTYYTTSQVPDVDDEDNIGYGSQNNQESTSSSTATMETTTTSTVKSTTTTTEKSIGAPTECFSSGFIGDVDDCKIFYRCVDDGRGGFKKYEFKCGDGTVWDPDIEACNHAWAVKKCGGSTDNNEDTTTNKDITTPYENIKTTVTLIQITTQASTQNDDYDTGYGSQNHEVSTTTTIKTTKQPQVQENDKNNECKSTGFMGDKNDCKKFYRCVDDGKGSYIRYEFTCGEGTVWDPKIEACNHAWAVEKCGESNNVNTETTSQSMPTTIYGDTTIYTTQPIKDTDKPVTTTTTSLTSTITTNSDNNKKCLNSGFMGDSSDCKKFYRCVDNGDGSYNRYEFTCGEGTVWDPKTEACNHAWAVEKCGGGSESTQSTQQQTTSQHTIIQDEEQENGYATPSYETSKTPQITTSTSSSSAISTSSSGAGQCINSGFMGDKNDCKKFYRCVDNGNGGYDRYEFQCGEGTVWDGNIEACNHAWAVKNCKEDGYSTTHVQNESTTQSISSSVVTTTTTEGHHDTELASDDCMQEGFFGNQKDCKKFYRCVDNTKGGFTKYEYTCGEGTSWNQYIQGCDHATPDRPCGVTSQEPTYLDDDMEIQTTSTRKDITSTEEIESTQATKNPQISKGTCESEGFYGNPSDCKKFYRCVANSNSGFTKYDFSCGDGTVWNQEIQACDHESADKTCNSSSSSQTHATESHSESTTSSYVTTKKQETTEKESSGANGSECTSEGFFAHPNDCKKFIRCVSNSNGGYTRYEFSCGDGTVWAQEIQACDHDDDVTSCSTQIGSTSKPQNTGEQFPSTSDSSVMSSTESMTPIKEDDEYYSESSKEPSHDETDDCTSEGYFANKQDCRKFYRCVDNGNGGYTKYDFVCGEGTAWDSDLQTCNYINEVPSCSGSTQGGSENSQTTTNENQVATESTSSTTKATTLSSESSSSSSSNSPNTCESEGYFGDSNDCKKFYRCVDDGKGGYTKYDFTCGDGTIWDQDITTCNHPQDVSNLSCGSDQGISDTSSTTSSTTSSSSQTTSSTTESSIGSESTSDSSQQSSKKPASNNVTCDKAGYYANPNDCKKFYRCVDWDGDGKRFSVFHFECGEGTIWDPALDTCNHEDSVYPQRNCSETQSQNVGGETTTTEGTTSMTTSEQTTTQESATSEQTTTQQSTTSEQIKTTTQQSTTSEKTTTLESTTSEQTTQQSTTSETTTQVTTTSETTTQQLTTSEKTTTQEPATSEQTTTQQSTTSEKTTTQEPATSEQTTTQQSATSDKTTTQEPPATSEQTTTQQSTTSEKSTTQEPATSEQTTTQQSTTSEQTTTQESTTSEQTTTQQTISSETTTQESTTSAQTTTQLTSSSEQTTTQESTTSEQTTTQQSTTSEQTTTEQSNEQTTEESTTTTEQTTEGTTSTEETTDQSTTQISSTESDSTEDQTTTESSLTDKECPETEDDQYLLVCPTSFRRHPKYCNMFYQCTEDDETYEAKVAMFKCPNNTIYDESQTQCVTEDKADKKCDGEIANKRRFKRLGINYKDPILADRGRQSCSTAGYFSFEKHSECSKGFLKCERSKNGKIRGHVYQCPDGYIYWSISKRCERIESVRGCKRSSNDWTGRWNIPVERKNVAAS